jgi:hypothetical protein
MLVPVSMHTGLPLAHDRRPTWHLLVGVQGIPSLQLSQEPSRQTWPLPQAFPLGSLPPGTH